MTVEPLAVRPLDVLSPHILRALSQAGVCLDDHASLCVAEFPSRSSRGWERTQSDLSVVAFVSTPSEARAALDAGAVDAIVGVPDALRSRIELVARVDARWRSRHEAQLADEHRTASELQSTRDLLSRLIDATPCPVMAVGPTGSILVFNHAAEAILGYDRDWANDNLLAADVYADTHDAWRVLSAIRASPTRLVRDLPVRLRTRSGDTIEVQLNAAEVYAADGLPVATIGVFLDSRASIDLRRRLEATTRQLMGLETRNQALASALGRVHFLNQPLNTSMITIEMLTLHPELTEKMRQRLTRVYGQLETMADSVADLTAEHHRTARGHRLLDPIVRPDDST